ncbi:MAG: insulinase family protein [Parachlamydiales bacterium]|jgi:hypothetical protein
MDLLAVGQKYKGFIVTRSVPIPELQVTLLEIEHTASGAQIMHIIADDDENAFSLSFQTRPSSSNGVAHILEHTVLCGSEKYPVRDPFFSMTRRSLNTYMNALTGNDFTCYPAASQVEKDFYNLLDIYIDAVFHPKLHEYSFKQEGHRLELNDEDKLEVKGIVYNEMKGSMASANARLAEKINELLYPDVTYGKNSGGTPPEILNLTHEELRAFHDTYYHPSRCLFYFYGNIPTEKHLDFIGEALLDKVTKVDPLPPVPKQPRFTKPVRAVDYFPAEARDTPENNSIITVAWLTCDVLHQEDLLALCLIDSCMMDTDASPLKRALLDSKLCKQVFMTIDPDNAEVPIAVSFRGCDAKNAEALEKLLLDQITLISKEGIDPENLESALHQLELHRSEITGDGFPFGLTLFTRAALLRQHGALPENGLMIHTLFDEIRKNIETNPKYLSGLIDKYFVNNTHRVTLTMAPDHSLAADESKKEEEYLNKVQANLNEKDKIFLREEAAKLQVFQENLEEQDEDTLPIVSIHDIPKKTKDIHLDILADRNLQVFFHEGFTNQIAYIDYAVPLTHLDEQDLPYMRLLVSLFGQMGCGDRSFMDVLSFMHAHTGGAGASTPLYYHTSNLDSPTLQFCVRGKALNRNVGKLCELLYDMAQGVDFKDKVRLKEIILKQWTSLQSSLTQSSMRYASNLAASGLHPAGKISYEWYGLGYYHFIKNIAEDIDKHLDLVISKLEELQTHLLHGNYADLTVACDDTTFKELQANDYFGLNSMPKRPFYPWLNNVKPTKIPSQGRVVASPVAFTSVALPSIPYAHPDAPALRLAAYIMDNVHLHTAIREQGGAYGGGANCNTMAGIFSFYGYRDPNIQNTLNAFQTAIHTIAAGDFTDDDIFEAKLEIIQGMDSPIAPGSRSDVAYTWWRESKTYAMRQKVREITLGLNREQIALAVQQHIVPGFDVATTVVFANNELLESENALLKAQGKAELKILPV